MYLNKIWINYPHKYNGILKTIDVSTTKNEEVDACFFWCDMKKIAMSEINKWYTYVWVE